LRQRTRARAHALVGWLSGRLDSSVRPCGRARGVAGVGVVYHAFMTVDAWEHMNPNIILGIRNINKYVASNPQWWVLEIFDGFGAHLLSHNANEERFFAKILSLKEE
jgi:hypothetical protein